MARGFRSRLNAWAAHAQVMITHPVEPTTLRHFNAAHAFNAGMKRREISRAG
jgi:site-specific recombinase XerD